MSLLSELKRRNVIRVGTAYLIVGWLVLQISDVVLDFINAPEWTGQAILALLVLGLIVSLVLAWVFEVTPEGIRRDDGTLDTDIATRANRLNTLTIIAAVLVAGMFVWQQTRMPSATDSPQLAAQVDTPPAPSAEGPATDKIPAASIAVLPFADLSPEGDQSYFSDGIAEEILNVLVRVKRLRVASRTSAFGFKGQEALGIPFIAEKLQVRHVLEGSVRKAGDTVRITAQLIDAETDAHVWSQTFDRQLTAENVFAIQDEIAAAIVKQLGTIIGDESVAAGQRKTATDNLDAYEAYLKAQSIFSRRSNENIPEMVSLYERAVELDPEFAEAWAGLAAAYSIVPGWNLGEEDEYLPKAEQAAAKASSLDDSLARPYTIRASIAADRGDPLGAVTYLDAALTRDPRSIDAHYVRGVIQTELGLFDDAGKDLRECLDIDPGYEICRRFLSFALLYSGREQDAVKMFETGLLRGQSSWVMNFAGYFASQGNESALVLLVTRNSGRPGWSQEPFYRLLSDPSYPVDSFFADMTRGAIAAGDLAPEDEPFKREMPDTDTFNPGDFSSFFWSPYDIDRLRPDMLSGQGGVLRKQWMLKRGVVAYWRERGFPPQCRPVGEDDFWCEGFDEKAP